MKKKSIQYGLRYKKKGILLKVQATSNEGRTECVSISHSLVDWTENPAWLVDSPEHAEFVRQYDTPWYNAEYDTPINNYDANELEVVKVVTEIEEEEVCVNIPTFEQMMKYKYKRQESKYYSPQHYTYVMNEFKKSIGTEREKEFRYGLYDLGEYIRETKENEKLMAEKLKKLLVEGNSVQDGLVDEGA